MIKPKLFPLFALFSILFLSSACNFEPGYIGCNALGAEGVVEFDFMQPGNPSEPAGNAFSAGTVTHLEIEPADNDDMLPPWDIESSDENIMTVEEVLEGQFYPIVLAMRREGPAEIQVKNRDNEDIIDYLAIEVVEPDGLGMKIYHPIADDDPIAENVLLAAGYDSCELKFYPFEAREGAKRFLYGEYEISVEGGDDIFDFHHMKFEEIVAIFFAMYQTHYSIFVSANSEGNEPVTFKGPRNVEIIKNIRTVLPEEITEMHIVMAQSYREANHVGDTGELVAIQGTSDGNLCSGFPVLFETDNPEVLGLTEGYEGKDYAKYYMDRAGTAVVTATLESNPAITTSLTVKVKE